MKKIVYYTILAAMLLTSCEKQVEIDIDAQQAEVVMMAQGETGSPLTLRLTYSRPVFSTFYVPAGEDYFKEIDDAVVSLEVNGTPTGTVTHSGGNYTIAGYLPQAGDRLSLSVSVPGHKVVTADAIVPKAPAVDAVSVVSGGNTSRRSLENCDLKFSLTDDGGSADYYSVRVRVVDTAYYTAYSWDVEDSVVGYDTVLHEYYADLSCTDYAVVINTGLDAMDVEEAAFYGNNLLFTDANINGLRHDFKIKIEYGGYEYMYYDDDHIYGDGSCYWVRDDHNAYFLEVKALSRDMYMYEQSMASYDDDVLLALFSEPVQIHSNLNGGIGIFGVGAKTVIPLRTDDKSAHIR